MVCSQNVKQIIELTDISSQKLIVFSCQLYLNVYKAVRNEAAFMGKTS